VAAAAQLAVWSATSRPQPIFILRRPEQSLSSVGYSPDGRRLVTAGIDGQLTFWEAETGKEIPTVQGHFPGETASVFSPDGQRLVSVTDCTLRLRKATSLELIKTFRGHRGPIWGLAVSRDGKFLVTCSMDKTVKVWDLTDLDRPVK
jgi:WD40 repeat protein